MTLPPSGKRSGCIRVTAGRSSRSFATAASSNGTRSDGYERAALYIRADNLRSQQIHSQHGACYQLTCRNVRWGDNSVADARCFMIDLHAGSRNLKAA